MTENIDATGTTAMLANEEMTISSYSHEPFQGTNHICKEVVNNRRETTLMFLPPWVYIFATYH